MKEKMLFVSFMVCITVSSYSQEGQNSNISWSINDSVLTLSGTGEMRYDNTQHLYHLPEIKKVVIEEGITSIGNIRFNNLTNLRNIEIPNSVIRIDEIAFFECSLTNIEIPNSVISIGKNAFRGCISLISVKLPEHITHIEEGTFFSCTSLESIEIPDGVTDIGEQAFFWCANLINVKIPNIVTDIGNDAFHACHNLTNIEIPNSVINIGSGAFQSCGFTNIEIPNSVTNIGRYAFSSCSSLVSIEIPNSITDIEAGVFSGCSSLTDVEIPNSVVNIGNDAFARCSSFITIEIPNSVVSIGSGAFYGCTSLTSIEIPKSVTKIGGAAFSECYNLIKIELPDNICDIESHTFYNCFRLPKIEIPKSLKSIGDDAFCNCRSLTKLDIPDGVTSIGNNAFQLCDSLVSVKIPTTVSHIGVGAFIFCYSLTDVNIPDGITIINNSTFYSCMSLKNIEIPYSVTHIESNAFNGCSSLQYINIPDSVTSIGAESFHGCRSLTNLKIPNSVTNIGQWAFSGFSNLEKVEVYWEEPLTGLYIFENSPINDAILIVPFGTKSLYEVSDTWKDFGEITEREAEVYDPDIISVILDITRDSILLGDTLQLTAIINPSEALNKSILWSSNNDAVATVDSMGLVVGISEGVTTIFAHSFNDKSDSCVVVVYTEESTNDLIIEPSVESNKIIIVGLELPAEGSVTGSFVLSLPESLVVDLDNTALAESMDEALQLVITSLENSSWLFEIVTSSTNSLELRSGKIFRHIVNIAYKIDENTKSGNYEIVLSDIDLTLSNGEKIKKDELVTTIAVISDDSTDIYNIGAKEINISFFNGVLIVDTPEVETIRVYNLAGNLVFTALKKEEKTSYNVSNLLNGLYFVTGSSGWSSKIMKY